MNDNLSDLYDDDPKMRLRAAARYRPTPGSPSYWGDAWPERMAAQVRNWPLHLIGTANAWLVYVAPNPGPWDPKEKRKRFIEPVEPTLGAKPHPHVADYEWPSWTILRKLVVAGFKDILDRPEALASFMLANLAETNSARSTVGSTYGDWGWPRIQRALRLTRPRLVMAQNRDIYDLLCSRTEPASMELTSVSETQRHLVRRRRRVKFEDVPFLVAEAETHFAQGTSWWSTDKYLPMLTREALES